MRRLFAFLFLATALLSCKKQSELLLYVKTVDVDWKNSYFEGDKPVRINVVAESQSSVVTRIVLEAYLPEGDFVTICDSMLASPVRKLNMDIPYRTPRFPDTTNIDILTTIWTQNGETARFSIMLIVLPTYTEVASYESKTIYSAASHGASAFSWETFEPFYPDSLIDPGVSFYDVISDDTVTLSRTWTSTTLLFSRFEGFNFADATLESIEQAFLNSSPSNRIRNIHDDDVILIGTPEHALGAIKVILVSDMEGVEQDRYIFSVKARK